MRVAKPLGLVLFGIALLSGGAPVVATSVAPYRTYVACSTSKQAPPSHTCPKKGDKAAFFKSRHADVTYKVCVKYPTGTRLCAAAQQAQKGTLNVNTITSSILGDHRVTWFVGGKKVGAFTFTVKT